MAESNIWASLRVHTAAPPPAVRGREQTSAHRRQHSRDVISGGGGASSSRAAFPNASVDWSSSARRLEHGVGVPSTREFVQNGCQWPTSRSRSLSEVSQNRQASNFVVHEMSSHRNVAPISVEKRRQWPEPKELVSMVEQAVEIFEHESRRSRQSSRSFTPKGRRLAGDVLSDIRKQGERSLSRTPVDAASARSHVSSRSDLGIGRCPGAPPPPRCRSNLGDQYSVSIEVQGNATSIGDTSYPREGGSCHATNPQDCSDSLDRSGYEAKDSSASRISPRAIGGRNSEFPPSADRIQLDEFVEEPGTGESTACPSGSLSCRLLDTAFSQSEIESPVGNHFPESRCPSEVEVINLGDGQVHSREEEVAIGIVDSVDEAQGMGNSDSSAQESEESLSKRMNEVSARCGLKSTVLDPTMQRQYVVQAIRPVLQGRGSAGTTPRLVLSDAMSAVRIERKLEERKNVRGRWR